jgi:hypothetical protein
LAEHMENLKRKDQIGGEWLAVNDLNTDPLLGSRREL